VDDAVSLQALYRDSRAKERELGALVNGGDPTALAGWPRVPPPDPATDRFAVVFAGGMHSFAACVHSWTANVVDASGGKVDFYFHVWGDELAHVNSTKARWARQLAKGHPSTKAYVEESFSHHLKLLEHDEPRLAGGTSWIGDIEATFDKPGLRGAARPFRTGAGYSQWRKIFLGFELVKASGVKYAVLLKARPDVTVLYPLDFRTMQRDLGQRASAQRAKGHWFAMPERTFQVVVDHFAMGTPEAMYSFAAKPLPYTQACCEGYVWRNLVMRGFARTDEVNGEDFNDTSALQTLANAREQIQPRPEQWGVVPAHARGHSDAHARWAPLILTSNALHVTGDFACTRPPKHAGGGAQACVPLYRTKFAYVFKARSEAWLGTGALCLRYTNDGTNTGAFMVAAGLAHDAPDAEAVYGNGPCVIAPTLAAAFESAKAWLATLDERDREKLVSTRERRRRRLQGKSLLAWAKTSILQRI
jgi:hypothetical protein